MKYPGVLVTLHHGDPTETGITVTPNPNKVNDNHMEELYQATPEELKENRRLLQVQGDDNYFTTVSFLDRALKKAQVRGELRIHHYPLN